MAGNEIILARTKGVGIFRPTWQHPMASRGRTCGPPGVAFDLRKNQDYLPYDRFEFEIPVGANGDCWDRWWVRLLEIRQSARIIQQAIDGIPSGPLQAKVPQGHQGPAGETYVRAENPKGEMGYYLVSRADRALPAQDPLGLLLQHLDPPLAAEGCPGPRHHRHHGEPRLRPRGRRQMIEFVSELFSKFSVSLAASCWLVAIIIP